MERITALKPIENRRVRAVAAEKYPLNKVCAHPECREDAVDPHHCFPRSEISGSSWFVEITSEHPDGFDVDVTIPHVAGLCRRHHDDVEEHRAWIKLEDGVFVWYDRCAPGEYGDEWRPIGPLNPQPGSVEGKPKRKKFQGLARARRKVISLKVPQSADEDLAGQYDDKLPQVEALISGDNEDRHRSPIFTILSAFDYVLLNEGSPEG